MKIRHDRLYEKRQELQRRGTWRIQWICQKQAYIRWNIEIIYTNEKRKKWSQIIKHI